MNPDEAYSDVNTPVCGGRNLRHRRLRPHTARPHPLAKFVLRNRSQVLRFLFATARVPGADVVARTDASRNSPSSSPHGDRCSKRTAPRLVSQAEKRVAAL